MFWGSYRCEKWGKDPASLHAENRAIDWHLDVAVPADKRAAEKLIRLLLAADAAGEPQALARRMGVEELIWDCGYWGAGMTQFTEYRPCYGKRGKLKRNVNKTIAHRDHVHIGMTKRGAAAGRPSGAASDDLTPYSLDAPDRPARVPARRRRASSAATWRWAPRVTTTARPRADRRQALQGARQHGDELPPLPKKLRARVVAARGRRRRRRGARARAGPRPRTIGPKPDGRRELGRPPAVRRARRGQRGRDARKATALSNGVALPPFEAPEAVKQIIEAGNIIARTPYMWGGGHGKWQRHRLRLLRLRLVRARRGRTAQRAARLRAADVLGQGRARASG